MTKPSNELMKAELADVPAFVDIYMTAFQDKVAVTRFPRCSLAVRQWWIAANEDAIRNESSARLLKIIKRQEIIAFAKWNVPTKVSRKIQCGGDDSNDMPGWPQDADKELCEEFSAASASKGKEIMGKRQHLPEHLQPIPPLAV